MKSPIECRRVRFISVLAGGLLTAGCNWDTKSPGPPDAFSTQRTDADSARLAPSSNSHGIANAEDEGVRTLARFVQLTRACGVDFAYLNGEESGNLSIVESLGGGAALFDFDRDGNLDLFIAGGGRFGPGPQMRGRPPAWYRNAGLWRFDDVTSAAGVDSARHYSHGAAAGDCDNDGFTDVVVTGYGGLMFFRNQGDGTFVEGAVSALMTDALWS